MELNGGGTPFYLSNCEVPVASLSLSPPALVFDVNELSEWGWIWRLGTKLRKRADSADDEDEGADDGAVDQAVAAALASTQSEICEDLSPAEAASEIIAAAEHGASPSPADPMAIGAAAVRGISPASADVPPHILARFKPGKKYPSAFDKKQGMDFGQVFDKAVGQALATMLGGVPVKQPKSTSLLPEHPDCVEVGPARVIGGVRPQNFDVAYRPDGVRVAYDSKTLNDAKSVQKNWQNMVNDLGTEATTVHTRFPYAVVAFIVAIPKPALGPGQQADLIRTLERLGTRRQVIDQNHLAEAIAFVVWDPATGLIDPNVPDRDSSLRYEQLMPKIFQCYVDRYKGLPPHDK